MPEVKTPEACVLVVDDEEDIRRVASLLLEDAGFRVLTAASGEEAHEVVEAEGGAVDAVLLDVMLPDGHGGEIAADLRRLRPELAIVVSSGYDEETVTMRVGEISGARYLRKPYAAGELVETLAAAIAA